MNTQITRVWMNNCNNFIISDCSEKHAAALAEMVSKGGIKLEDKVAVHELGEVVVVQSQKKVRIEQTPTMRTTLRSIREIRCLSVEEVSKNTGISVNSLKQSEIDSAKMKLTEARSLLSFYRVSPDYVYFGKESDAFDLIEQYIQMKKSPSIPPGTVR